MSLVRRYHAFVIDKTWGLDCKTHSRIVTGQTLPRFRHRQEMGLGFQHLISHFFGSTYAYTVAAAQGGLPENLQTPYPVVTGQSNVACMQALWPRGIVLCCPPWRWDATASLYMHATVLGHAVHLCQHVAISWRISSSVGVDPSSDNSSRTKS